MGAIGPKNRTSKARRNKRKANCSKCGALIMPHRVCKECGTYNKRQVVKVEEE